MKGLIAGIAAGLLLVATPVLAQEKDKTKKDVTVFDFEEDEVSVDFLKPDVGFVGLVQQQKAASLIKIRQDFVDEIVRSAEDL